jgi:hypothetical protein
MSYETTHPTRRENPHLHSNCTITESHPQRAARQTAVRLTKGRKKQKTRIHEDSATEYTPSRSALGLRKAASHPPKKGEHPADSSSLSETCEALLRQYADVPALRLYYLTLALMIVLAQICLLQHLHRQLGISRAFLSVSNTCRADTGQRTTCKLPTCGLHKPAVTAVSCCSLLSRVGCPVIHRHCDPLRSSDVSIDTLFYQVSKN